VPPGCWACCCFVKQEDACRMTPKSPRYRGGSCDASHSCHSCHTASCFTQKTPSKVPLARKNRAERTESVVGRAQTILDLRATAGLAGEPDSANQVEEGSAGGGGIPVDDHFGRGAAAVGGEDVAGGVGVIA